MCVWCVHACVSVAEELISRCKRSCVCNRSLIPRPLPCLVLAGPIPTSPNKQLYPSFIDLPILSVINYTETVKLSNYIIFYLRLRDTVISS